MTADPSFTSGESRKFIGGGGGGGGLGVGGGEGH